MVACVGFSVFWREHHLRWMVRFLKNGCTVIIQSAWKDIVRKEISLPSLTHLTHRRWGLQPLLGLWRLTRLKKHWELPSKKFWSVLQVSASPWTCVAQISLRGFFFFSKPVHCCHIGSSHVDSAYIPLCSRKMLKKLKSCWVMLYLMRPPWMPKQKRRNKNWKGNGRGSRPFRVSGLSLCWWLIDRQSCSFIVVI